MNPQPHPIVGQFGVLIFSLLVAYFCFFGNNRKQKPQSFSDNFIIGNIYDINNTAYAMQLNDPEIINKNQLAIKSNTTRKRKKTIPTNLLSPINHTEKNNFNQQLFDDCMLVLISLGTKKAEAKNMTKKIFENHKPKTIEEFIKFAYVKI